LYIIAQSVPRSISQAPCEKAGSVARAGFSADIIVSFARQVHSLTVLSNASRKKDPSIVTCDIGPTGTACHS
jgi:hypothetical protein